MSQSEPIIEMVDDGTMYRVAIEEDGFYAECYVSSMHLVDEKVKYLRQTILKESLKSFDISCDDAQS